MKAEIICVGTELLLGQIVNTNAQFLARQLNELGINHYFQTVVGDNPQRLIEVTELAESRSDIIIYTGGLGPTRDDLTKESIAQYLDEDLVIDQKALDHVKDHFAKSRRKMNDNNIDMAKTFKNGMLFENKQGQAVGTAIEKNNSLYIILPGPPSEMKAMFLNDVKPYLLENFTDHTVMTSEFLNFFGIGESDLANRLDDLIEQQSDPSIAIYVGDYVVSLRLTSAASSQTENEKKIKALSEEILDRVGDWYYGSGYNASPTQILNENLKKFDKTISFAESFTGGEAATRLVRHPGASQVFRGSIVAYDEEAKINTLAVDPEILQSDGMVSEACAREMAKNAQTKLQTDYALSFTGVAGPDSMEGHPAGTVYIGLALENGETKVFEAHIHGGRDAVRVRSIYTAFIKIIRLLNK